MKVFKLKNVYILFSTCLLVLLSSCDPTAVKPGEVVDPWDGKVYHAIRIGEQVWMVENFQRTYNIYHQKIPNVTDNTKWADATTAAYCDYENDPANAATYGHLYNWATVKDRTFLPFTDSKGADWVLPTEYDFKKLESYLRRKKFNFDGDTIGYVFAKSLAGQAFWTTDDGLGSVGNDLSLNNRTKWNLLPGGYRDENGVFMELNNKAVLWSACSTIYDGDKTIAGVDSTRANARVMSYNKATLDSVPQLMKRGISIKLIKAYKRW